MQRQRAIGIWLLVLCVMVFVMVVLGGLTRLTESGLSMVEWKPLTGWLPPMSEAEWQAVFARYRASLEYQTVNQGMTLDGFKSIFWLEFVHRLWGRVIAVVFAFPFAVFALSGRLEWRSIGWLLGVLALGAGQGMLGWYMVTSGLADVPEVSPYRLLAHLALALVIFGWLLWLALGHLSAGNDAGGGWRCRFAAVVTGLVFLTALSGGLVAGLDAGLSYNTFPTMEGEWVPAGVFAMEPLYANFFENLITAQFDHRVLAATVAAAVALLWLLGRWSLLPRRPCLALDALLVMVVVQVSLGIATLLLLVPVTLAALHQAGAVLLFAIALWLTFELRLAGR